MINSSLLKNLSVDSLLTVIPGLAELIFEKGKILTVSKDEVLIESGSVLTGLYIPIDQDLILEGAGDRFFLLKGRSLALKNLLSNEQINYQVKAELDAKIIFLERTRFIEHLEKYPLFKNYLLVYTQSLAVRNFKRFFEQLNVQEEKLRALVSQITPLEFKNLDDLKIKAKNQILFINSGTVYLEFFNLSNKSIASFSEGTWFGTEAINPPHELSYKISNLEDVSLYSVDLKFLEELNCSFEVIQKIEDEPCLKLNLQEDDQYLSDPSRSQSIGDSLDLKDVEYLADKLNVNLALFSTAKSNFYSYTATLKNFCTLHGMELNTANCNSTFKRHLPNLNLSAILEVLQESDLVAHGIKVDKKNNYLKLPLIIVYQNRLILLIGESLNSYIGHDPIHGYFKISKKELFDIPDLEIIEAELAAAKNKNSEELFKYHDKKDNFQSWEQAKKILGQRKQLWFKIMVASVLIFLVNIIPPFISQEIIDEVLDIKDLASLYTYGIGLILCYFTIAALGYYRGKVTAEFSYLFDHSFSTHFYHKLLKLKSNFFGDNRVGEVFARLGELSRIREFFSGATVNTIINLITAVIYSFILLFYSWKIAVIPIAAIFIIGVIQFVAKKYLRVKYLELFSVEKKTQSQLSEMINSISTVKAFMSEKSLLGQYEDNFLQGVRLRRDLQLISSFMTIIIGLFSHVVRIVAIWVGVTLIFKHELSIGELFSINMFISRVLDPLNSLVEFLTNLEEVKVSLKKLEDVFGFDFSKENQNVAMSSRLKGRIHLDRISFRYKEESPEILKDIDLTIYPKQIIAIVGESGCGKTTLANLIAGNLVPTKGKIFFDGMDQKFISNSSLKSQVGFIQQSNDLFAGTIESNVTYAHTYTNQIGLNHSLDSAHCHEFIDRFPTGLNQFLAEGGMGLSGGQKQRLSIARTLYNNPRVLVMDEATSALDSESEAVLIDNIKKLSQGKTTILIAHRLSTIRHADQVFVMEEGRIVEVGNHHDLVQKRGKYYELFKEQMR